MTFSEMIDLTASMLELEADDDFKTIAGDAINTAYAMAARDKWRPIRREKMTAVRGKIRTDGFSENFLRLKRASAPDGEEVLSKQVKDFVLVPEIYKEVFVEYYYLPPKMEEDFDTPCIPEACIDSHAYVYYAASVVCNVKRRHAEAAMWDTRFRNIFDNAHETKANFVMPERKWR